MDVVLSKMPVETVILPMLPDELIPSTVTFTDLLKTIDEAGWKSPPPCPVIGTIWEEGPCWPSWAPCRITTTSTA